MAGASFPCFTGPFPKGALKTVGFGIFDLLACLALKASKIDVFENWKSWNGWDGTLDKTWKK